MLISLQYKDVDLSFVSFVIFFLIHIRRKRYWLPNIVVEIKKYSFQRTSFIDGFPMIVFKLQTSDSTIKIATKWKLLKIKSPVTLFGTWPVAIILVLMMLNHYEQSEEYRI